jgi:hypothetical protein
MEAGCPARLDGRDARLSIKFFTDGTSNNW